MNSPLVPRSAVPHTGTLVPGAQHAGSTIAQILGQSEKLVVYTTTGRELRWTYGSNGGHVPSAMMPAVTIFDGLMSEISETLSARRKGVAYVQLGKALFAALDADRSDAIEAAYGEVKRFIASSALHSARFVYTVSSCASAGLIAATCLLVVEITPSPGSLGLFLRAAAAGIAGALMSVLHRSGSLALDGTAPRSFLILQGISRVVLGGLFAVSVVLACQGELILGFAKDHPFALFPLSIVAGFSERFVPEIMARLENTP